MTEFSLDILLKAIKLARSTYYYHLKQLDKPDKDQELKAEIQSIFIEHKGNYAYRRIYLELRNRGYLVNHKRVQGLIKVLNLQAKMRQNPNFKLKLATQKKFTWRLVVQAFFRVVVNPIFDKSYFFRSRFLGSFR
ncbi:IS3-Spn1 transposase [Streptococcus pneumoniae]|nr:IS3-Spn1 transposase [Streptococcus pneumoniae]